MGMRPRILGTLTLLQKTALAAATVAATEVAVNAATHAMVSHPLLRHLAGDVACAGVAARRMIVWRAQPRRPGRRSCAGRRVRAQIFIPVVFCWTGPVKPPY